MYLCLVFTKMLLAKQHTWTKGHKIPNLISWGLYMKSVLSAGHFDRIIKNIVVNSCTQCEAMAFHCCSHSRHLFTMAECPNDNSIGNSTVELLAANTTEATDLMDSYSRNYQNKIHAKMSPQQTPAVSQND